jgi:hypothetical protein
MTNLFSVTSQDHPFRSNFFFLTNCYYFGPRVTVCFCRRLHRLWLLGSIWILMNRCNVWSEEVSWIVWLETDLHAVCPLKLAANTSYSWIFTGIVQKKILKNCSGDVRKLFQLHTSISATKVSIILERYAYNKSTLSKLFGVSELGMLVCKFCPTG